MDDRPHPVLVSVADHTRLSSGPLSSAADDEQEDISAAAAAAASGRFIFRRRFLGRLIHRVEIRYDSARGRPSRLVVRAKSELGQRLHQQTAKEMRGRHGQIPDGRRPAGLRGILPEERG